MRFQRSIDVFLAAVAWGSDVDAPGYRIVVNGADVSAIVERGTGLNVSDQISQQGAVAKFRLIYDPNPPVILVR